MDSPAACASCAMPTEDKSSHYVSRLYATSAHRRTHDNGIYSASVASRDKNTSNSAYNQHQQVRHPVTGWMWPNGFNFELPQWYISAIPAYLSDLCSPVTALAGCRGRLRSASSNNLFIPHYRLSTYGLRAFSVAGPVCWNAIPYNLKSSDLSFDCFGQQYFLFWCYWR